MQNQLPEVAQLANKQPEKRTQDFTTQMPMQGHGGFAQTTPWSQEELRESMQPAGNNQHTGTAHATGGALDNVDRILHETPAGGKTQSNLRVKANHNQHLSTGSIKHSGKPMLFLMANEICKGRRCPVNNVPNDPM